MAWNRLTPADQERIEAETFIASVSVHRELASTNDSALHIAGEEATPLPLLVVAERQTAGRGRGANRWWSDSGALTFSVLLDTASWNLSAERWPRISLTAASAVCELLGDLLPLAHVGLKWPNDVVLQHRKVCGILVEIPPQLPRKVLLGIGLNVNNSLAEAPADLQATATSVLDVAGNRLPLGDMLIGMLHRLGDGLEQLAANDAALAENWRHLSTLTGRTVHLKTAGQLVVGVARTIDDQGALVLQNEAGESRHFGGVITHVE